MDTDLRSDPLYREAEALYRLVHQPGTGQITDAAEISTNGVHAVYTGTLFNALHGGPQTRICWTDLRTGSTRVLTHGPNMDRSPKFSPNGQRVAHLSDRGRPGDFQLHLLDPESGACRATPSVGGWVEYLQWSPDGQRVLLGVAGHGADVSGGQGAVASKTEKMPESWMPIVETGDESYRWRCAWVYELAANRVRQVSREGTNVWESAWCGNNNLAAVISTDPSEGSWYSAHLAVIEIETGTEREAYSPQNQLGLPASSPSGRHLAIVEALCSDRGIVAGDLHLLDTTLGDRLAIDTRGIDITYTQWCSERRLLLAGHRGFDSVVGIYDVASREFRETWSSCDITTSGRYISVSGLNDQGDCVLVGENFWRAPEIAVIRGEAYQPVRSFDLGYAEQADAISNVECVSWKSRDDLEIQGWLLLPRCSGAYPLVMVVHGGPVWHSRPTWLGRSSLHLLMLLKRGYAVFLPNPRGSGGRGQEFARRVLGDIGGGDMHDLLSGLDYLVERGVADPRRLAVTGGSYGGFMTAWLTTQDARFRAAVAVAPHTNQVTEHLIGNIPRFVEMFVADKFNNAAGRYFQRSPVMYACNSRTPTLNICGALDRCTPPEEAVQFHRALLEGGTKSVLVIYPQEGHGIRRFPALIDYAARVVHWFDEHL